LTWPLRLVVLCESAEDVEECRSATISMVCGTRLGALTPDPDLAALRLNFDRITTSGANIVSICRSLRIRWYPSIKTSKK